MGKKHDEEQQQPKKRGDRWFLFFILFLFLAGLSVRGYGYLFRSDPKTMPLRPQTSRGLSQKAFPEDSTRTRSVQMSPDNSGSSDGENIFVDLAPYLTEGGLSFFIGFCLGYFLRLVAKATILIVGAVYFGLLLLSHYGMVTVDWGSIQQVLQQLLLNTQTHLEGLRGMLAVTVPSAAMGGLGIWRGLKK